MPGSRCQAPWGYLLGVDGLLWGIWEVFVTLGVDKLRSLVYACLTDGKNIKLITKISVRVFTLFGDLSVSDLVLMIS
jgi:hypothetical protein